MAAKAELSKAPKKNGRPLSLIPDAATIARVKGLGMIQATHKEMEKVLGVSVATLEKFLAIPEVRAALEAGQAEGLTSLRRKQFSVALAGNPTMLIWLGKNHLGQADKTELSGKDGGPIQTEDLTDVTDRERAKALALLVAKSKAAE